MELLLFGHFPPPLPQRPLLVEPLRYPPRLSYNLPNTGIVSSLYFLFLLSRRYSSRIVVRSLPLWFSHPSAAGRSLSDVTQTSD